MSELESMTPAYRGFWWKIYVILNPDYPIAYRFAYPEKFRANAKRYHDTEKGKAMNRKNGKAYYHKMVNADPVGYHAIMANRTRERRTRLKALAEANGGS
jgi:hypothetical protein